MPLDCRLVKEAEISGGVHQIEAPFLPVFGLSTRTPRGRVRGHTKAAYQLYHSQIETTLPDIQIILQSPQDGAMINLHR